MGRSRRETELDADQLRVVETDGRLVVASVAGSGKTHTLVHKIGRLLEEGVIPSDIQVLTFGKRASDEFAQRLRLTYGASTRRVPVRTFHSFGKYLLEKHGNAYRPGLSSTRILKPLDIHVSLRKTLVQCGTSMGLAHLVKWRADLPPVLRSKAANEYCSACQDFMHPPDLDPESDEHQEMLARCGMEYDGGQLRVLHEVYRRWTAEKERRGWLTYDDMISMAVAMLQHCPEVRDWVQSNISHLFVDEYQDTSPAQQALVELCGEQACWTLVGDDDQSIFGFRHANPDLMIEMAGEAEGRDELCRLQTNYRSGDDILQVANSLISKNEFRIEKSLVGTGKDSEVVVTGHADRYAEALHVARNIKSAVEDGVNFRDCMVLMRTNAQAAELTDAFLDAEIPYRLPKGVKPFYELPEVQDLEAYLRLIMDPEDDLAIGQIINRPPRGVNQETIDSIHQDAEHHDVSPREAMLKARITGNAEHFVRSRLGDLSDFLMDRHARLQPGGFEGGLDPDMPIGVTTKELIEHVIAFTDYRTWVKGEGRDEDDFRLENVDRCLAIAEKHPDPRIFLMRLGLMRDQDPPEGNEVTISTIHKAKGLESELVFLVGCQPGLLPHAKSADVIDEERRLCYVAVTRAKYGLYISYSEHGDNLPDEIASVDFIGEMGLRGLTFEEEPEGPPSNDYVF